jgi:plastocyanin
VVSASRRGATVFACGVALLAILAPSALAAPHSSLIGVAAAPNGAQRVTYKIGPFHVIPGQNDIQYQGMGEKPKVDGWITRMRPDLVYTNGTVPRVDVIHLHHGVWLNMSRRDATSPGLPERFFAAGEEKTIFSLPKGYAYEYKASDHWLLNYMIHNLTPVPANVYMELQIDFIPKSSPAAKGITAARPIWMDVRNGQIYPVFNVKKGSGKKGSYTYPNDQPDAYAGGHKQNQWTVDRDGVLIATAGHLHPGGEHTDLWMRRQGAKVARPACASKGSAKARKRCKARAPRGYGSNAHLFRSTAKYFEPAGAVSWDVAMSGTRPDWRVKVRKGDTLWTSATYGTKRGSWWESMGIMVVFMVDGEKGGKDPYRKRVDYAGKPTHGHLYENRNHGGGKSNLPDPRKLPDGPTVGGGNIDIVDFKYAVGDFSLAGSAKDPPVIPRGQSATFTNLEAGKKLYHSITSCKAPCTGKTGIAYPLADSKVQFESTTLGNEIPAAGATSWKTPANLKPGTYTYFCRIHPFMRGAFRVK